MKKIRSGLVLLSAALLFISCPGTWLTVPISVGTLISALNVAYRDFRYVIPFLVQLWLFVTPVVYPASLVPEGWRHGYATPQRRLDPR